MNRFTRQLSAGLAAASFAIMLGVASPANATSVGNEGCTPGYWKNHTANWQEYQTTTPLSSLFTFPTALNSFGSVTMLSALDGSGGPGVSGATTILMRAATAAYLNAAHEGLGYPYRRDPINPALFSIRKAVNDALASQNRQTILALATLLDNANNLGCPLNNTVWTAPAGLDVLP